MLELETDLSSLNLLCTAFGVFFVSYGTFSYLIKERLFLGEAPLAVLIGIALGPYGLAGILNKASRETDVDSLSLGLSRVVIGIQLTLVGVQLPYKYPWVEIRSLVVLLVPIMTVMWLATTLCIWLVIPSLPVLAGLVIATSATPTDPVLSNAIVKGAFADQYVSPRLRNLISGESGANDGFGYPFLFLAVHLIKIDSTTEALKTWLFETCLYTVGGSVVYGIVVGYLCRRLLQFSTDRNLIDKESFLLYGAAMGVFIIGSGGAMKVDDLLAAFVAGNALSWTDFYREQCEESEVDNCLDLLLNVVFFSFLGATIPWDSFNDPANGITPGRLLLMCLLVLLFRRLPAMIALYRYVPTLHDFSEACFVGYFAPIGAGALFYLGVILDEFKPDDTSFAAQRIRVLVKPITYALILSSIVFHSLAIPLVKIAFTYWDVKSVGMEGESDKEAWQEDDTDSNATEREEHDLRVEYSTGEDGGTDDDDEGGALSPMESRNSQSLGSHYSRRSSRVSESDHSESYRHSTVHRPEHGRGAHHDASLGASPTHRMSAEMRGAYHTNGSWDNRASWRMSSGHKLGAHHRLKRNPETGELELDPYVYTNEHGLPSRSRSRARPRGSRQRSASSRARPPDHEDRQSLLEQGRGSSYGSVHNG